MTNLDADGHAASYNHQNLDPTKNHDCDNSADSLCGDYARGFEGISVSSEAIDHGESQQEQAQNQLSAADVTKIVQQAQKSSSDPATTAINIFNGLGNNVSVTGDALRQGIKDSKVALDDASSALLANATSLTKNGSQVTINSARQTETNIAGVDVRIGATVKFTVGSEKGNPTLSNISGLGAKKGIWLDVQKVSVGPYNAGKAVFIQAGKGIIHKTVPIPLSD